MSDVPKVYAVSLTNGALKDIRSIKSYIAEQLYEPNAARRTVAGILAAADALSTMPFRNRTLTKTASGLEVRAARSGKYSIIYIVTEDEVRVVAVLYSASDIQARLTKVLEGI